MEQTEPKTSWARRVTAFAVDRNPVIDPPPASREPAQVQYVGGSSCAYLDMWINEKSTTVLVDADGVNNLVPKSLVRPGGISGSARTIQTPDGTETPILGETILWCRLGDIGFAVRCLVVEQMSETVFGAHWLKRHRTTYDFAERWLTFGSQTFRLRQPPVTGQCNRIFLVDDAAKSVLPTTVPGITTSGCSPTPDVGPESMSTDIEVPEVAIAQVLPSPPPETVDDTLSGEQASTPEKPPSESCVQLVPVESLRVYKEVLCLPRDCPKPNLVDNQSLEL